MKLLRRTTLHFKQGSSDKIYEVDILALDAQQHLVNFRYGRTGKTLTEGSKTAAPISLQQAETLANSLLVSKINEGYQVIAGYDPVNKTTLGAAINPIPSNTTPTRAKPHTRDDKILARLQQFALGSRAFTSFNTHKTIGYIDGYSLTRSIWKAGELRIAGLVEALQAILASQPQYYGDAEVFYYSIAWALARSRDPQALPLLNSIREQIPEHLYQFALLQTAPNPQLYLPTWQEVDLPTLHKALQAYNQAQRCSLVELAPEHQKYFELVVQHHGLSEELNRLNVQLSLEDLKRDYLTHYLSPETQLKLKQQRAAFPELEPAMDDVLAHRKNQIIDQALQPLQAKFMRYQTALKEMQWPPTNPSMREAAIKGQLNSIWNHDLETRIKRVMNANGISRSDILKYAEIQLYHGKDITPTRLEQCHKILQAHGVEKTITALFPQITNHYASLPYLKSGLSLELRSRIEKNLHNAFTQLSAQRLIQLRKEAGQQIQQQVQSFQQHILSLYAHTQLDTSKRPAFLTALNYLAVEQSFHATFRQVYKLAELLDDYAVLARLNQRLELGTSTVVSGVYGQHPFSQNTQNYFKRRMVRLLNKLAKFEPKTYTQLAQPILLQADDQAESTQSVQGIAHKVFPRLHAFNFILHTHSQHYRPSYKYEWSLWQGKVADLVNVEAHPKLWQKAPEELLGLLRECKAQVVNDFAYRHLQKQPNFLAEQTLQVWLELVARPYENTATLSAQHLVGHLADPAVGEALLNAQFSPIRQLALSRLTAQHFQASQALLVSLLCSPYDDVYQVAKDYLYTAQQDYPSLVAALIERLIETPETTQSILIPRFKWLLTHPLAGQTPLQALQLLLAQDKLELQRLAGELVAHSPLSFTQLAPCFEQLAQSTDPELQAGAVALLAKLTDAEKAQYLPVMVAALIDHNPSLRTKALGVISSIQDLALKQDIWQLLVPELFKAEPVDGFNADLLQAVANLSAIYPQIDEDLLWRLLNAQSALAQQAGALILPTRHSAQFSIKQLAMLTKNPSLSTRNWALQALEQQTEWVMREFSDAVRMLDNRWDDTRQAAIQFLLSLPTDFWTPDTVVMVCDQVYTDVQQLGRELILKAYQVGDGEVYLLHLSQHPSLVVQQFVSDFLVQYTQNQPELIIKLAPYFKTVLMQINRARLVKDRVIAFLFQQAQHDDKVANMVAHLFTEQALTRVLADRTHYLKTLVELQTRHATPSSVLKTIQPELRAY